MNIAEFKQLLDIPEEAKQEVIQHRFSLLAESLFRNFQIEKEGIVYDLLEIEFYFWSPAHQDNITYPRHCPAGLWYFHPSGVDISFASDENHYGGILLRSVVRVASEPEVIAGPVRLANHLFDCLDATGNDILYQPRLVPKLQPDTVCCIETAPREIPASKQGQALAVPYCYYVRSRHNCHPEWKSVNNAGRPLYYSAKPWLRHNFVEEEKNEQMSRREYILNLRENNPTRSLLRRELTWEELENQIKNNNPQGYHPREERYRK